MELKRSDLLRKESEKFQKLFNSTSDGVFQLDPAGCITLINKGGAKILGFESPEVIIEKRLNPTELNG